MNFTNASPELRQVHVPVQERVLNGLADSLFAVNDVLEMLRAEDAVSLAWMEAEVRRMYDIANELMKKLSH